MSFLQKATLGLGCLLLASALICWVAANWEHASAFQKLAGAQALLIAVVLLTWRLVYLHAGRSGSDSPAAVAMNGLAAVCTGALLALVGQNYQTGADAWTLFAGWAVLLLPWLAALPSVFLGVLCAVLLNVSAALYLGIYGGGFAPGHAQWLVSGLLLAALNALMLALWEWASRRGVDRWRVGQRVLALLLLSWLLVSGLAALGENQSVLTGVVPGLLSIALLVRVYTQWRTDAAIVSAAAFAGLCLVSIPLFDWMALEVALPITIGLWLVAVGVLVGRLRAAPVRPSAGHGEESAASAELGTAGLRVAGTRAAVSAEPVTSGPGVPARRAAAESWSVSLFRLAAMALTAILTIALLFVVVDIPGDFLWLVGLVASGGGLLLLRGKQGGAVVHEAGLTLTAAGLLLFCGGLYVLDEPDPGIRTAALLAFGVILYRYVEPVYSATHSGARHAGTRHTGIEDARAHVASPVVSRAAVRAYVAHTGIGALRFLCAFSVLGVASVLTWPADAHYDLTAVSGAGRVWVYFPAYLRLWWLAVAAIIALAVGSRRRDPGFWSPLAWALVCLTQLVAWLAPAPSLNAFSSTWLQTPGLLVLWLACALLAPIVLAALLWPLQSLPLRLRVAAPLALAVASLGWTGAPGIAMAFIWMALGHAQRRKALVVFGVLALLAYLGRFYYQLDASLLQKSLVLCLTGGWLLVCRIGLLRIQRALTRESSSAAGDVAAVAKPGVDAPLVGTIAGGAPGGAVEAAQAVWPEAGGAVAGTSAKASSMWVGPPPSVPRHSSGEHRRRAVGLIAGLALILLVVNVSIARYERILASGTRVVLALAPVDPRSLMQGDYMAIRFDVAEQIGPMLADAPADVKDQIAAHHGGYMALRRDAQGVHRLRAVAGRLEAFSAALGEEGAARQADVSWLEFRLRDGRVKVATDAWFFPEGSADRFEAARYGELRVDGSGRGLLTGLLDSELKPL